MDEQKDLPGEPASTEQTRSQPTSGQPTGAETRVVVVKERNWGTKIVLVLITVVMLALAGLLAVTWLPRWWAQRVGGVVDGTISNGVFAGLTCGVVFTAIPLLFLRRVFAWHGGGVASRIVWLLLAIVVAAPNLTTLGIVLGNGNAAHAGERILDVEAPAFRTATAVGAGIGAVMVLVWWMLLAGRHRRARQVDKLKAEVRARDEELRTRDEELRTRDLQDRRPADLEDRRTTEDAVRPTDPEHRPHDSPRD